MSRCIGLILVLLLVGCGSKKALEKQVSVSDFHWQNATVYFLLTDRFYNADPSNDFQHPTPPAPYRGFMGGDIKGITAKIEEGYFDKLGVDVLWMTPLVENIAEGVDEGTGLSYAFHGYWTKDWTKIDQRLGTEKDVEEMVSAAHKRGIRILMDAVINHTGPVTPTDIKWPDAWVRTSPRCTYKDYKSTTACVLVDNLPDIKTESTEDVNIPPHLAEKWKSEGRYEKEMEELDAFFKKTGYPRRPFYYIIKWLTDLIKKYGIDGFRVDTVKHTEEEVWKILKEESSKAYNHWKKTHPTEKPDDIPFFMVGEVYNYYIGAGRWFDFGDRKVDYFSHGFDALINFDFKYDAKKPMNELSEKYDTLLHHALASKSVMNYISSHDDGAPFDKERKMAEISATKLLLSLGIAQIYYGDETARSLSVKASGDAVLRSFMNWDEQHHAEKKNISEHWQKLGSFRKKHIAVGAGRHFSIDQDVFGRKYQNDVIVCAINQKKGIKIIPVEGFFKNGQPIKDHYSGMKATVINGKIILNTPFDTVLLERDIQ